MDSHCGLILLLLLLVLILLPRAPLPGHLDASKLVVAAPVMQQQRPLLLDQSGELVTLGNATASSPPPSPAALALAAVPLVPQIARAQQLHTDAAIDAGIQQKQARPQQVAQRPAASTPLCPGPPPTRRLPATYPDWVFAADGTDRASWASQFRLAPAAARGAERPVHLISRLSGGCVNLLGNDVRGHRHATPRDRAAPPSRTTELRAVQVAAASASLAAACEPPVRLRFQFTSAQQPHNGFLAASARDGSLGIASSSACAASSACDFDVLPVDAATRSVFAPPPDTNNPADTAPTDAANGAHPAVANKPAEAAEQTAEWIGLRSVLTGRLVSLHHSAMPEVATWLGIHTPRATPKPRHAAAERERTLRASAAAFARSGGCQCPIRSGGFRGGAGVSPPAGWRYNCSLWAPLIDEYLSPWHEGNVSATVLDMAFWRAMYGAARAHAIPGVHVSSVRGVLRMRENVDYRVSLFRDMMRTVSRMVELPDVEFVVSLWDHPKVDRQTPLPVFVHYADVAHRDVPIPAPWSWDDKKHSFPQPWTGVAGSCGTPWSQRDPKLYFRGGCNGPTRGWRGPLWQFYPRKRANRLSAADPANIDAGVYDHCDSPKLSKLEWGWDANMEREMHQRGKKRPLDKFAANCRYKHLLHIDGNLASSRLASELHVGSTVFKQASFSNEYFYPLLAPFRHYVPIAANLEDVPEKLAWAKQNPQRAEAIAAEGQRFAREHLHTQSIACYFWQLLTTFGALQDFQPRVDPSLGFRPV